MRQENKSIQSDLYILHDFFLINNFLCEKFELLPIYYQPYLETQPFSDIRMGTNENMIVRTWGIKLNDDYISKHDIYDLPFHLMEIFLNLIDCTKYNFHFLIEYDEHLILYKVISYYLNYRNDKAPVNKIKHFYFEPHEKFTYGN